MVGIITVSGNSREDLVYKRGQDEEDPKLTHDLPWNRHKRRRLLTSKGVVLRLFAGEKAKEWGRNPTNGIEVITPDINEGRNQDLHNPGGVFLEICKPGNASGHHRRTSVSNS